MLLLETQYLPSAAWCAAIWGESQVAIDAAEHYQKGGLRNRCHIAGPNGPQQLSIHLAKGKHQQTPIREVRIAYREPWQRQHWRSIQAAYGRSPFFEHYADGIRRFYEHKWEFLFDYNFDFQTFVLKEKMGWAGEFVFQNDFFPKGKWPHGKDLRGETGGEIGNRPAWFSALPYPQVFQERAGFLPNLSVLDLLFCCGKTGGEFLTRAE